MTHWPELVELYEYKVADVCAGHMPRGGAHALAELRELLLGAELSPALQRRLMTADRQYRQWRSARRPPPSAPPAAALPRPTGLSDPTADTAAEPGADLSASVFRLPSPGTPGAPPPVPEAPPSVDRDAWTALQWQAWHTSVSARLASDTRDLRHEPDRPTLRVLYALTENAERTLRNVRDRFAVPAAGDPLASLGDKEVVAHLTDAFSDLLGTPQGRLALTQNLTQIHENPFPVHPDEVLLREQLRAAEREPLTPQARSELIQAIRRRFPQAPDPKERPAVREAAKRLEHLLDEVLAQTPDQPMPPGSVLYGQTHTASRTEPDPEAQDLVIYLGSDAQETVWQGLPLRWQPAGQNWQLQVGSQVRMLHGHLPPRQRHLVVTEQRVTLKLYYAGPYLLLRREGQPLVALGHLAAQARAAALLLSPQDEYGALRLARAAAQVLRGSALNLAALHPDSADKFRQASPDDQLQFVRQGLNTLLGRVQQTSDEAARHALMQCAQVLQLPGALADSLYQTLHRAAGLPERIIPAPPASAGPAQATRMLSPNGLFHGFRVSHEPLNLGIKGRLVTLRRDYKGDMVVTIPGLSARPLDDLLVVRLNDLDLLLVYKGDWLAVAGQPHGEPV